jgi:hypothetical protein
MSKVADIETLAYTISSVHIRKFISLSHCIGCRSVATVPSPVPEPVPASASPVVAIVEGSAKLYRNWE